MRLLVTRPASDAAKLAKRLRGLGHSVHIAPLIQIHYMQNIVWPDKPPMAFAITSANGVRALIKLEKQFQLKYKKRPQNITAFAVGQTTAKAARLGGWQDVFTSEGSVPELIETICNQYRAKGVPSSGPSRVNAAAETLWHISGDITAGDLVGGLQDCGLPARRISLYEAIAAETMPQRIMQKLSSYDGVLLYSKRSAHIFTNLTKSQSIKPIAYCLSQPIADEVRALGYETKIASTPTDRAMAEIIGRAV